LQAIAWAKGFAGAYFAIHAFAKCCSLLIQLLQYGIGDGTFKHTCTPGSLRTTNWLAITLDNRKTRW